MHIAFQVTVSNCNCICGEAIVSYKTTELTSIAGGYAKEGPSPIRKVKDTHVL
jgi:hypothetical protein